MKSLVPFHEDEHVYMNRAVFFDLYRQGDFHNPLWQSFESDYSKLPDILYGITVTTRTRMPVTAYLAKTSFNKDTETRSSWNVVYSQAAIPLFELPKELYERIEPIRIARWASLALSIGSLALVMLIWHTLQNWMVGLFAMISLGLHPLFVYVSLTTMGDSVLLFFSLLTLFISLQWLKKSAHQKHFYQLASLLGISLGCAVSAKLNGIFAGIYLVALMMFLLFKKMSALKIKTLIISLFITTVTSAVTFLTLTPQIWFNPVVGFFKMIQIRNEVIFYQQRDLPHDALLTIPDRFVAVSQWAFTRRAEYGDFQPNWLQSIVFLFGLGVLITRLTQKQKGKSVRNNQSLIEALFLWCTVIGGATIILLPLNWNRYYLPIIVIVVMIQSYGLAYLLKLAQTSLRQIKKHPHEKNSLP